MHLFSHKLLLNSSDEHGEGREEVKATLASATEFIMGAAIMSDLIEMEKEPKWWSDLSGN